MTYAIVDIETTGGYAAGNSIIEISVKVFDGVQVIEEFDTLVNPCRPIPRYIQAFTGITDEMVQEAPLFEDIAQQLFTVLQGNVFVAHNVNFDYSFIKSQLEFYGYSLNEKKLCTIRLARQIVPGLPRYGLEHICSSLNIPLLNHHRAGSDASATVQLFQYLMERDEKNYIRQSLSRTSKEQSLPPNVPKTDFDVLPKSAGVYYFHNQKGQVVYVGKAKNIRTRVNSHFSNNSDSKQKQNFLKHTCRITFKETGTELMAAILESTEIRRLWPIFNTSQKRPEELFGIFVYEDQNGYMRLAIEKKRKTSNPIYTFHYKVDGYGVMRKLMKEFLLCPKLCFIQTDNDACTGKTEHHCHGACEKEEQPHTYNERVLQAIASLTKRPSYVVLGKGLKDDQLSCILMLKGTFFGMGYLPKNFSNISQHSIQDYITPYKDNSYIQTLVHSYAQQYPHTVTPLPEQLLPMKSF